MYWLHTVTAESRSTRPFILSGTVKRVSGLSDWERDNKLRWWVWMSLTCRGTHISRWLSWSEDWLPLGALRVHSSNEPGELSQWLCQDDSIINISTATTTTTTMAFFSEVTSVSYRRIGRDVLQVGGIPYGSTKRTKVSTQWTEHI